MEPAQTSPSLEQFVTQLLEDKGVSNLEPEIVAQMRTDLLDRLEDHLNAALFNALPEGKQEEFQSKIASMSEDETQDYLAQSIPDMPELVASTLLRFRQTYLAG